MKSNLSTTIPFAGFYYSVWSQEFDHIEENEAEYFESDRQAEEGVAKELRLTASEYADILYRHSDYSGMYLDASKAIASAWNDLASEHIGFELGLTFEQLTSPREYNFETDRLFMSISRDTVAKLFRIVRRNKYEHLAAVINERFTSYDGFRSYYSNRLADWLSKPLSSWDHNEIGTLLIAALVGFDANDDLALYYAVCDSGDGFFMEWQDNVNWQKVEEDIADLRILKAEEIREDDPDYIAPEPRCPLTLELPL